MAIIIASKEAAFSELSLENPLDEAVDEAAKAAVVEQKATLDAVEQAVVDVAAKVKAASTELVLAQNNQQSADEELEGMAVLKTELEVVVKNAFAPLMEGLVDADRIPEEMAAVMSPCKSPGFDSSLVSTASQVLQSEDTRVWRFELVDFCWKRLRSTKSCWAS